MTHVIIVGEGQTEETFAANVLRPHLAAHGITVEPRLVETSQRGRGGGLTRDRVIRALSYTLRESGRTFVTTFFDLYALKPDFPGIEAARAANGPLQKSRIVEAALAAETIAASGGCRAERFMPHIQPYEFEALLFSDVAAIVQVQAEWRRFEPSLRQAREDADTPEHINDGPATHPSARLTTLLEPRYKKPLHGSRIAASIGLARIREECRHFDAWLAKIESLQPL
jgi:hypothetical protein